MPNSPHDPELESERAAVDARVAEDEVGESSGTQSSGNVVRHPPSHDTDAMAAPTEPALDMTPGASLTIKRATLMHAEQGTEDGSPTSLRIRNIESYVGFIVDGRYHIESVIAQGGMGVVYFARHRLIDKPVALKILRPELVHNREITARFLTEAQSASAIGNEHIVDITDFGELPDGATYIVMEFLDGLSLNQRIRRSPGGLLPLTTLLAIAREIAEGLQQAHDANIVHRDLKPDNVLLIRKGKQDDFVKILDFGIAKVQSSQNQTTTAGRIFGTPHYMSPEQGRGDDLDHRTDIYSLGVILYEMVSGHVPFDGENPLGILTQHMYVEVKSLSSQCPPERVTPALESVVARCLMKDPQHRYASMAELDEDLRRLQNVEPPLAWDYFKRAAVVPEYLRPLLQLPPKRPIALLPGLMLALVAAAFAATLYVFAPDPASPPAERVETSSPVVATVADPVMTVNLAAEPIDAHVFRGQEDLGQIPLLVQLLPGQIEYLVLQRPGYKPHPLVIDGSKPSYAIRMTRLAGPPTPVASEAIASPTSTRVVDLRTLPPIAPWPIVSLPQDAGASAMFDGLFGDDDSEPDPSAFPAVSESLMTTPSLELPPQHMDPRFAPEPPGPPASDSPGPRSASSSDGVVPADSAGSSMPSSRLLGGTPPPGPPPVKD